MKIRSINTYSFDELSDNAKNNARQWWRNGIDFAWCSESLHSIESFCGEFNAKLTSYSVNPYESPSIEIDRENTNFRGRKLKAFKRDAMPTGYCLDCALYVTFFDSFKKSGDAKKAFDDAIWQAVLDWRGDMEYQLSDESIDENIRANEYEFLKSGVIA